MSHGRNYAGKLLDLGGIKQTSLVDRCENKRTSFSGYSIYREIIKCLRSILPRIVY